MPIPEMSAYQKYEQFIKTHPQYKKLSFDRVCSIMVKEKYLTPNEVKELKNPLFGNRIELKPNTSFIDEGMTALGIDINKDNSKPKNYVERPKKYHPMFKELEITKNGKADLNQFTLQSLKQKYNNKDYNVNQNEKGLITVTKKDGTPVMSVFQNFSGPFITYNNDGKILTINLSKNGDIDSYSTQKIENEVIVRNNYRNTDKYPYSTIEKYSDGSYRQSNYDKTGKITFQDYWKKDGSSAQWAIDYSDGKPYKKRVGCYGNHKIEYILVDDLEKDITAKNSLGLPTTRPSLSDNVLKRITYDNVLETLEEYQKKTGRSLTDDIDNEIGLSRALRDKLINHIETLYTKEGESEKTGKYLAQKLFDDIQGLGSGKLADHVKMINSQNLKYVLTEYKLLTLYKQEGIYTNIDDCLSFLENIPGIKFNYKTSEDIAQKLAPIEGLLTAIQGEIGLKQSERNKLLKQIVDTSLNDKAPEVQKRIKRDISQHPQDYHKVEVDIYRAENSSGGDLRNPELKQQRLETSKNKSFNGQIKQGLTGDCWLVAGLNSIIAKPKMLKELEKLVKIDPKTGDYIVNLKGAKQTFRVTKNDIKEYTAIASGSEKVNAIEIAMDKYIRNEAYKDTEHTSYVDDEFGDISDVTIDGNSSSFLWRTLFGDNNDLYDIKIEPSTEDFNNPDRVYEMSLIGSKGDDVYGLAKSEKEENYRIISRHAYSIIGSDENNIYLLNPWDSEDKITITRENFKKLNAHIEFYELPKQG
ncbi:MAG: hypothetical protein ACI37Q_03560 [Candidatus Gastranaerophilaceae bacterium]